MKDSFRHFTAGLIDYAGLFPPAALPLDGAVRNHSRYLGQDHGWLLGRFVIPIACLREMSEDTGFPLAVIIPPNLVPEDLERLDRFRKRIAVLETRMPNVGDAAHHYEDGLRELHRQLQLSGVSHANLFVEAAAAESAAKGIADFNRKPRSDTTISSAGLKLRCGATDAAAAPSPETVAAAIGMCHDHDIPMKFTAGMHLPMRNRHPQTGEMQHGFLNIFAAALLAWADRLSEKDLSDCIRDEDPADFLFTDEGFHWRNRTISTANIQKIRRQRVVNFGSCSFEEPVDGLLALGLLDRTGA